MRTTILSLLLVVGTQAAIASADDKAPAGRQQTPRMRLLVPAYFYPAGDGLKDWDRLITASAQAPIVAIVNPASGPGKEADANYVKVLARAKAAKAITLVGYVSTSYGKRPLAQVQADVDQWLRLYPGIQGIFFDEQASDAKLVKYQADLYEYVRARKGLKLVITNPGTVCAEQYLSQPAADVACLFEGPKAFDPSTFPAWVRKLAADRVATLSYKIGATRAMRKCIQTARENNVGYCYVTDGDGANPWDRLPTYWVEEVAAIHEVNQTRP